MITVLLLGLVIFLGMSLHFSLNHQHAQIVQIAEDLKELREIEREVLEGIQPSEG